MSDVCGKTTNKCLVKEAIMSTTEIAQLISQLVTSVGFPCVICLVMCWYIKYLTDNHKAETSALSNAITELKDVMIKIDTKLDDLKRGE